MVGLLQDRTPPPLPRAAKKGGPLFEGINEGGPNKRKKRPLSWG